MKKTVIVLLLLFTGLKSFSQNIYSTNEFKISFESSEILEKYPTESKNVLGFENDNIAIDIEIIPIEQESKKFKKNIKRGAKEIAKDFGLRGVKNGGYLKNINHGYFVKGYGIDNGKKYSIFIIAILNYDLGLAYEISIDCYNLSQSESMNIIDSFRIIK
ncbi:hypothetical protein ACFSSB_01840 [Lacinutrix gracilariae]|uniref:PsbP C-terminal domain-containing protein n=1 Tax=Lacinutrix gracilariae TaxID=1747198 RepID=A0ABW5JZI4_9FLAO